MEKVQELSNLLKQTQGGVETLVEGVVAAAEASTKSGEQIASLEHISRRIDKIVDSITTVSIQTNMLAVNGSVEAARAGEFGKGFAVVSTDIRNLARDSAENAERIKDTVKAIQDQIGVVRLDLREIGRLGRDRSREEQASRGHAGHSLRDMAVVLQNNKDAVAGMQTIQEAIKEARCRDRADRVGDQSGVARLERSRQRRNAAIEERRGTRIRDRRDRLARRRAAGRRLRWPKRKRQRPWTRAPKRTRRSTRPSRQFVTFGVAGEMFAVPLALVREIIRYPDIVRAPLGPVSLEGSGQSARHGACRSSVCAACSARHTSSMTTPPASWCSIMKAGPLGSSWIGWRTSSPPSPTGSSPPTPSARRSRPIC